MLRLMLVILRVVLVLFLAKNCMHLTLPLAIPVPSATTTGARRPGKPFGFVPARRNHFRGVSLMIIQPHILGASCAFPEKSLAAILTFELKLATLHHSKELM